MDVDVHEPDAFVEHALRLGERFAVPAALSLRHIEVLQTVHSRAA